MQMLKRKSTALGSGSRDTWHTVFFQPFAQPQAHLAALAQHSSPMSFGHNCHVSPRSIPFLSFPLDRFVASHQLLSSLPRQPCHSTHLFLRSHNRRRREASHCKKPSQYFQLLRHLQTARSISLRGHACSPKRSGRCGRVRQAAAKGLSGRPRGAGPPGQGHRSMGPGQPGVLGAYLQVVNDSCRD